jgi:hypothetical protein
MSEIKGLYFSDIDRTVLQPRGNTNNGGGGNHLLFPFFTQGYFNFTAEVGSILGISGNEEQDLITVMCMRRVGQDMRRQYSHEIEIAIDFFKPGHHIFL